MDHGRDRYGRTIGSVYLPDNTNVSLALIDSGNAWVYRKYCKDPKFWLEHEFHARWLHKGIWKTDSAEPPWEYRHRLKH